MDPEQIESIFAYLRDHPEKPQSKRVEEILELLSGLKAGLSTQEKLRIIPRLSTLLRAYRWTVQISPTAQGFRAVRQIANRSELSPDDVWEYGAVQDLLDLAPYLGERPRIRRCAECKAWLFAAKRDDQKFCGSNCRQRNYDSAPRRREDKKIFMRKYRVREKAEDARAMADARKLLSRRGGVQSSR